MLSARRRSRKSLACLISFIDLPIRWIIPVKSLYFRKELYSLETARPETPLSPKKVLFSRQRASLSTLWNNLFYGSLTVETAVVLPLFVACMLIVLQLGNLCACSSSFSAALSQTAQELAVSAYAQADSEGESPVPALLSAVYAQARVRSRTGQPACVKNISLIHSSFLTQDDRIDLVLTYRFQAPTGLIPIPGISFSQRACVRGWTGRTGSEGEKEESGEGEREESAQKVYVAEHGTVYHTDPNCTHIHLSIQQVSREEAEAARNLYGGKYHCCEKCGKAAGDMVYITSDGNRYHSSLECSGLKRTVQEVSIEEAKGLRPCSRCGKIHAAGK